MTKTLTRLALVLILVSLACGMPALANQEQTVQPSPKPVSQLLVSGGPDATATSTPFQPVGPTSTSAPTATPIPTATFTPTVAVSSATPDPDTEGVPGVPTPIRVPQSVPEGTVNLMILGNDFRPGAGYRTDVMMLVSINSGKGTVNVVSFPRDLYITIPGWMNQRMNTAFPHGGFNMLANTMESNFGVRPTYYIMTNFQGFVGIINSLGGINVHVGSALSDNCDLPQAVRGKCYVSPGTVTMDGDTALWYVRSRHSSNDLDRNRRQQEVIYALFAKFMSLNAITRLPELYASYQQSVETNMGIADILPLLPVASQVISDSSRIQHFTFGPREVTNFITSDGAMVLLPNYDAINAIINQAVYGQ